MFLKESTSPSAFLVINLTILNFFNDKYDDFTLVTSYQFSLFQILKIIYLIIATQQCSMDYSCIFDKPLFSS